MKVALVILAVLAFASSAPQPRKLFHEHFQDFLDIIYEETTEDMERLFTQYIEFEEFRTSFDYMLTNDFRDLVFEMEDLPEFKAVIDFLERDNIDITYFLDILNEALEQANPRARQQASGRDFTSFTNDLIAAFPKDRLSALFDEKMANDEEFRTAIENLQSEEFDSVWTALWENETFLNEVNTLRENGIDVDVLLNELMAIFGQN